MSEWDIALGDRLTRGERRKRYGGADQGGINPSRRSPHVFIHSDPSRGEAYGYNYDGWDSSGDVFLYTGEGTVGDQQLIRGNASILNHREQGRDLRVFIADGTAPGSSAKLHRYIGEFAIDPEQPYLIEEAPDVEGEMRKVFVFRLVPVEAAAPDPDDISSLGDATTGSQAELIDPEAHETPQFERPGTEASTARRTESDLVKRYEEFLLSIGHEPRRYRLRAPGHTQWMYTDTYNVTTAELTEAKGTITRNSIREAIGQLYDYRRHTPEAPASLAVVLPSRPSDDHLDLLHGLGITCIYEDGDSVFIRSE